MKIIDRYILLRFTKKLLITFTVLMFIFFFHTIWLFIQELAGKNIGIINIIKFLLYYSPSLIYITLPLSVIVSSIMTFGLLAENYELVAIKTSGISLNRAMRSLTVFMLLLSVLAFFIANNLIPIAEYKNYKFQYNISRAKPSLAITQGVFSDLGDFNIKVNKKYGEDDRFLKDIVIHKTDNNDRNTIVITAETGELESADVNDFVKLILNDGYYYEDVPENGGKNLQTFAKSRFDTYIMNIDLSYLNEEQFDDSKMVNTFRMMTSSQLSSTIDSLKGIFSNDMKAFSSDILRRTQFEAINRGLKVSEDKLERNVVIDTLLAKLNVYNRKDLFKTSISTSESILRILEAKALDVQSQQRIINKHIISYHDKFSLAFACIILFFTAAPLGAIIKKGGLGLPMIMAIILFLSYYFIGLFSKNLAQNGEINPVFSAWISDVIILPIGIIFVTRATSDRNIIRLGWLRKLIFKKYYRVKDEQNEA